MAEKIQPHLAQTGYAFPTHPFGLFIPKSIPVANENFKQPIKGMNLSGIKCSLPPSSNPRFREKGISACFSLAYQNSWAQRQFFNSLSDVPITKIRLRAFEIKIPNPHFFRSVPEIICNAIKVVLLLGRTVHSNYFLEINMTLSFNMGIKLILFCAMVEYMLFFLSTTSLCLVYSVGYKGKPFSNHDTSLEPLSFTIPLSL